jgi:hypothetical protein
MTLSLDLNPKHLIELLTKVASVSKGISIEIKSDRLSAFGYNQKGMKLSSVSADIATSGAKQSFGLGEQTLVYSHVDVSRLLNICKFFETGDFRADFEYTQSGDLLVATSVTFTSKRLRIKQLATSPKEVKYTNSNLIHSIVSKHVRLSEFKLTQSNLSELSKLSKLQITTSPFVKFDIVGDNIVFSPLSSEHTNDEEAAWSLNFSEVYGDIKLDASRLVPVPGQNETPVSEVEFFLEKDAIAILDSETSIAYLSLDPNSSGVVTPKLVFKSSDSDTLTFLALNTRKLQ